MAFTDGRLYIAGLSNEEFASKLRAVKYPFATADNGTSVEIFHGNHGQLETRSPVYAFLPYSINNQPHLVAAYLCTPLVKFPVATLQPGTKVVGTTIAELGNRNRPIDMVLYKKDGREFLLMSNTARGVMKIPTDGFATAAPITAPVEAETGGVGYETVATMKGIEQLDLLDANRSLALSRVEGGLNLMTVALPVASVTAASGVRSHVRSATLLVSRAGGCRSIAAGGRLHIVRFPPRLPKSLSFSMPPAPPSRSPASDRGRRTRWRGCRRLPTSGNASSRFACSARTARRARRRWRGSMSWTETRCASRRCFHSTADAVTRRGIRARAASPASPPSSSRPSSRRRRRLRRHRCT